MISSFLLLFQLCKNTYSSNTKDRMGTRTSGWVSVSLPGLRSILGRRLIWFDQTSLLSRYSISSPCITVIFWGFFLAFCYVTSLLSAAASCLQHTYKHFCIHHRFGLGACSVSKEILKRWTMLSAFVLTLHVIFRKCIGPDGLDWSWTTLNGLLFKNKNLIIAP